MDEMEAAMALVEKWRSQSRKGFLDMCALSLLASRDESYGLDMMEALAQAGLEVSEGTLYPLLARMTREGSLASSWTTPDTGHPRKYYRLTKTGVKFLEARIAEWKEFTAAIERLMEKEKNQ